jgi:hypothetical protein
MDNNLSILLEMKLAIPRIETLMMGADAIEVEEAKLELKLLAERFHRKYEGFMSQEQLEWAKTDIDYFSFLLEEAIAHYKQLLVAGEIS